MANYDFTTLSPPDFEVLTRDLLQEKFKIHIESFKDGPDQGIDLRYTTTENPRCIVQCKHYVKSGFSKLLYDLKNKEKSKVDRLKPDRYILFTSVSLSPSNKDDIMTSLAPHIKQSEDIYGKDDINNLIGSYSKIERDHFKLWMASTSVLSRVLHARVFNQTEATLEGVRRRLSIFVRTPFYSRALKKIGDHGVCLIIGAPGVGKSTVAEMVAMRHIAAGWTAISVSGNASEAFEVFDPGEKQIFFYDDFLGQTTGDKLGKNEDTLISRLIETCNRNRNNKRLILVTRDYIFAAAKKRYEKLETTNFDPMTCAVRTADLGPALKAEMLVNHLYFHDVPQATVDHLIRSGAARRILTHQNYSPRIVEMMCQPGLIERADGNRFTAEFFSRLDNPARTWKHIFENHLNGEAQSILLALTSMGPEVESSDLEQAASALCQTLYHRPLPWLDYKKELEVLDNSFVRIRVRPMSEREGRRWNTTEGLFIMLQNPSVRDFLKEYVKEHRLQTRILRSANFWQQVVFAMAQPDGTGFSLMTDEEIENVIRMRFRSPSTEWVHSEKHPSRRFNDSLIQRATILAEIAIAHSPRAGEVALDLVVESLLALSDEHYDYDPVESVSSLYEAGLRLSSALRRELNVDPLSIANWMLHRISSHEVIDVNDYHIAMAFCEQHLDLQYADFMIDDLRRDFESWISTAVSKNTTAASLEWFIEEIGETAKLLDADIAGQLRELQGTLDRLKLDEEMHTRDLGIGEWDEEDSRPGKRVDDIATILNSLKSD